MLYATMVTVASSSASTATESVFRRLRTFTENVKSVLPTNEGEPSGILGEQEREILVAEAVSRAIGGRDVPTPESNNLLLSRHISKRDYDDVQRESFNRLFPEGQPLVFAAEQAQSAESTQAVITERSSSSLENRKRARVAKSSAPTSTSGKAKRARAASIPDQSEALLRSKLDRFMAQRAVRSVQEPSDSMRFLADHLLELLANEDFYQLAQNFGKLLALGDTDGIITYLFERVHRRLNPAAYTDEFPEIAPFPPRASEPFSEETFSRNVVEVFCLDPEHAALFPLPNESQARKILSEKLAKCVEQGKKYLIYDYVDFWLMAGVNTHSIARLLKETCTKLF